MRFLFFLLAACCAASHAPASAQVQKFEHMRSGAINDCFVSASGLSVVTCEDGGRVQRGDYYGTPTPTWHWVQQSTPSDVKDALKRVTFLADPPENQIGILVGRDGVVLRTDDFGTNWFNPILQNQFQPSGSAAHDGRIVSPVAPHEEINDVVMVDASNILAVGHHGIYSSGDGGGTWFAMPMYIAPGSQTPLDPTQIELYAVDLVTTPNGVQALVVGEPGICLRNDLPTPTSPMPSFSVVWTIDCSMLPTTSCGYNMLCQSSGFVFEPWDIEISRNPAGLASGSPLAVMVGGVDTGCGLIFTSTSLGSSWTYESHQCDAGPCGFPEYLPEPVGLSIPFGSPLTYKFSRLQTQYGVANFPVNDAFVAVGYNGEITLRDASVMPAVWREYSEFTNQIFPYNGPPTSSFCVYPFLGVACSGGSSTTGTAVAVGEGGQLRIGMNPPPGSPPGTPPFHYELEHYPYRIHAISFIDDANGWVAGQSQYIGRTFDEGRTWFAERSDGSQEMGADLWAIAMEATPSASPIAGVAVGSPNQQGMYPGKPKILRRKTNQFTGAITWVEPSGVQSKSDIGYVTDGKALLAATWVTAQTFIACGQQGLLFRSTDGGDHWALLSDPDASISEMQQRRLTGLSFRDTIFGVVVGQNTTTGEAIAYEVDLSNASPRWRQILQVPNSFATDVKIIDDVTYAVGDRIVSGVSQGVVWMAPWNGSSFEDFDDMPMQPTAFNCEVGEALGLNPILNRIAGKSGPELICGGQCGRTFRKTGGAAWAEVKSEMDADILSMCTSPGSGPGHVGYIYVAGGRGKNQGASNIVRWVP